VNAGRIFDPAGTAEAAFSTLSLQELATGHWPLITDHCNGL
jgi:hypothetical protein